jgi:hypothetical protein
LKYCWPYLVRDFYRSSSGAWCLATWSQVANYTLIWLALFYSGPMDFSLEIAHEEPTLLRYPHWFLEVLYSKEWTTSLCLLTNAKVDPRFTWLLAKFLAKRYSVLKIAFGCFWVQSFCCQTNLSLLTPG